MSAVKLLRKSREEIMWRVTGSFLAAAFVCILGTGPANAAAAAFESTFAPGISCFPPSCILTGNFGVGGVSALSVSQGLIVNTVTGQEHFAVTGPSFLEFGTLFY